MTVYKYGADGELELVQITEKPCQKRHQPAPEPETISQPEPPPPVEDELTEPANAQPETNEVDSNDSSD